MDTTNKASKAESLKDYLRIARFDHWIKQLFIFPGIVFAFFLVDGISVVDKLPNIIFSFVSTCFIASANYVINEWLDAKFDKYHPTKKSRPVVSGNVKFSGVMIEYAVFTVLGLVCGWFASAITFFMELWLWVMGVIYNVKPIRSKEIPYIDVLSESLNNAIRLLIGWFAITGDFIPPVSIILGYWMGGAFLMATKRYSEYRMIGDKSIASSYRKSFEKYTEETLLLSAFFYALLSVFFCGVFMVKYRAELIFDIPLICGLFVVYFKISFKANSGAQKPEKLFREKALMIYLLILFIVTCFLLVVDMPQLDWIANTEILGI